MKIVLLSATFNVRGAKAFRNMSMRAEVFYTCIVLVWDDIHWQMFEGIINYSLVMRNFVVKTNVQ